MEIAQPYLGPFVSELPDWRPFAEGSVSDLDDLRILEAFLARPEMLQAASCRHAP